MAAAGLLLAVGAGVLADLAAGGFRWLLGWEDRWPVGVLRFAEDVGLLVERGAGGPSLLEAVAGLFALVGAAVAAAAAVGTVAGPVATVYPALLVAVAGGHLLASQAETRHGQERAARLRRVALLVEPAFIVALLAGYVRWRAADLGAVIGAQAVLGPGLAVAPAAGAVALGLAAIVLAGAGAARLSPAPGGRGARGRGPGAAALATLVRWASAGAAVLVAAALAAGRDILGPGGGTLLLWLAAVLVAAVVVGAADAVLTVLPERIPRWPLAVALLVVAGAALALAVIS